MRPKAALATCGACLAGRMRGSRPPFLPPPAASGSTWGEPASLGTVSPWDFLATLRCGSDLGKRHQSTAVRSILCPPLPSVGGERGRLPGGPCPLKRDLMSRAWEGEGDCPCLLPPTPAPFLPPPFPHAASFLSPSPLPFNSLHGGGGIKEVSSLGFSALPHPLRCVKSKASKGHSRTSRWCLPHSSPCPPPLPLLQKAMPCSCPTEPALENGPWLGWADHPRLPALSVPLFCPPPV